MKIPQAEIPAVIYIVFTNTIKVLYKLTKINSLVRDSRSKSYDTRCLKMSLYPVILLLGCFLCATAFPEPDPVYNPRDPPRIIRPTYNPNNPPKIIRPTYNPNQPGKFIRLRRFVDGSQRFDGQKPPEQKRPEWELKPDISRDQKGNTRGQVTIQKHGENHDFEAGWGQNLRGPEKHSETWHAGGSIRW